MITDRTPRLCPERLHGAQQALLEQMPCHFEARDGAPLVMTRRRLPGAIPRAALLLVHGLCQNRYSWHLSDRSLAGWLAAEGYDVFTLELRGHGLSRAAGSPYPQGFADYVDYDAPAAIDAAARISGQARVFWVGHSLGGMIGYCLGPASARLAGLVALGSPAAFGVDNPVLPALGWLLHALDRATPLRFWRFRRFPATPFAALLLALKPWLERPGNRFPLQLWVPGSFQPHALRERLRRGFDHTGRAVIEQMFLEWARRHNFRDRRSGEDYTRRFAYLDLPLLLLYGNQDRVAAAQTAEPLRARAPSRDCTVQTLGGSDGVDFGHLDLVLGEHAPAHVWPLLRDWLHARSQR